VPDIHTPRVHPDHHRLRHLDPCPLPHAAIVPAVGIRYAAQLTGSTWRGFVHQVPTIEHVRHFAPAIAAALQACSAVRPDTPATDRMPASGLVD
jgi:hypothetical protein